MIQNFISKLSPKEKKIGYIAAGFFILAVVDLIFIRPTMEKLKILDDEIKEEENVIKRDLRFLTYKDRILKENQDLNVYFSEGAKTEEEIIADFLKSIEILATESSINLIRVNPQDTKQKKGYIQYFADLECDGKLEDAMKFVHKIDVSNDLLKVVKLNLLPKRASADSVSATMTVMKVIVNASASAEEKELMIQAGSGFSQGSGSGAASSQGNNSGAGGGGGGGSSQGAASKDGTKSGEKASSGFSQGSGSGAASARGDNSSGGGGGGGGSSQGAASKDGTKSGEKASSGLTPRFAPKGQIGKPSSSADSSSEGEGDEPKPSLWESMMGKKGVAPEEEAGDEE